MFRLKFLGLVGLGDHELSNHYFYCVFKFSECILGTRSEIRVIQLSSKVFGMKLVSELSENSREKGFYIVGPKVVEIISFTRI